MSKKDIRKVVFSTIFLNCPSLKDGKCKSVISQKIVLCFSDSKGIGCLHCEKVERCKYICSKVREMGLGKKNG